MLILLIKIPPFKKYNCNFIYFLTYSDIKQMKIEFDKSFFWTLPLLHLTNVHDS